MGNLYITTRGAQQVTSIGYGDEDRFVGYSIPRGPPRRIVNDQTIDANAMNRWPLSLNGVNHTNHSTEPISLDGYDYVPRSQTLFGNINVSGNSVSISTPTHQPEFGRKLIEEISIRLN